MPVNKNAMIRYQVLDKCFRNTGRNYTIDDLVEECNQELQNYNGKGSMVKKRQVYEDIKYMKSDAGYAIELEGVQDGRRKYLRYKDRNFSINNQPVNEAEANQIQEAMMVLSRFTGMPQFNWINEVLPKLEQSFNVKIQQQSIIHFEENPYLAGLEWITPIFNAIQYEQVLRIIYKPFEMDMHTFIVHPYILKQYNTRWFLFGLNAENNANWTMALDRILKIETLKDEQYAENTFDYKEYFDDRIGVSAPQPPNDACVKVRLKVDKNSTPFIKTKPLHSTQTEKKELSTDAFMIIDLNVVLNYEFKSMLLSFGEHIEVLSPVAFREEMAERVRLMFEMYE